ncbi:archaellin/type IV pilin N-terminal domain-containing protein [Methanohalophilus euhalobius]|jgi:flagellin FlaB|uniref:Flagellin n=1 Tax=Methanohalophilus euhalobius TaxID=51203 RepID=A0A314ZSS3_9EURY|nr:archaellin/type IV pilin N-terminal domain-containing protein [Methanohalophilus euhalobius]PQV42878.1 flagellin FlaB [Methanohalophilus euhalobius]RNI10454.1 flagellin [Methanohalophilus euhalobius]RSD35447.1 MAG: archaeal flagellin FlaB [Methanohalophilus sp.]
MLNKFNNNDKAFTGLEAAIVLIAFVVVAAVFSYVMLGAGFYTTQKSQEVVHTGVQQASSSVELTGDIIAEGDTTAKELSNVTLFLQLTAGGSPVDINKTLIVYSDANTPPTELTRDNGGFNVSADHNGNGDSLLDSFEKFEINIGMADKDVGPNEDFQLEIKPPAGASYTIQRQAPPSIDTYMTLY